MAMHCTSLRRTALLLLCASALFAAAPAEAQKTTIRFGTTSTVSTYIAHYIALDRKFYDAENLQIDTIVAGSAANAIQQLGSGSVDIAQAATDQTLRAITRGAPIIIVSGAVSAAVFRVLGAKSVKDWAGIKGKKVSVGGPSDQTLYFFRTMARKNGLADTDYDLVYAGGTPDRFAHLLSGVVAASVLTNPLDFTALQQGYPDLGLVPHYLPNWAQNNVEVHVAWAQKNRAAVVGFLRAFRKASVYFYDPANRAHVIELLVKDAKNAPEAAEKTYDFFLAEKVVAPDAALFEAGIQANLDAFLEMGEMKVPLPPVSRFVDASFLAEAGK
jgi:ABC-type nitrate/sulfonate/bicarbonate transport system substrate-binding protein